MRQREEGRKEGGRKEGRKGDCVHMCKYIRAYVLLGVMRVSVHRDEHVV